VRPIIQTHGEYTGLSVYDLTSPDAFRADLTRLTARPVWGTSETGLAKAKGVSPPSSLSSYIPMQSEFYGFLGPYEH